MEGGRGDDEDGGVDEEREGERDGGVGEGEAHRLAPPLRVLVVLPRLHDGGVEVEVVRHHRRAEDAHRDVEHLRVLDDPAARQEAARDPRDVGPRLEDLEEEAHARGGDEGDDERLEEPEALVLQEQDDEHVERRDRDAEREGDAEEEIERDRGPDHLGEVAGGDGQLAEDPERERDGLRVVVAARLGEVAAGDDAELGGEPLEEHRHQVGDENDAEQRVPERGAAGQVRRPVARVHVADGHQVARPGEREQLAPPAAPADGDGAIDLGEARRDARPAPPGLGGRCAADRGPRLIGLWDRERHHGSPVGLGIFPAVVLRDELVLSVVTSCSLG